MARTVYGNEGVLQWGGAKGVPSILGVFGLAPPCTMTGVFIGVGSGSVTGTSPTISPDAFALALVFYTEYILIHFVSNEASVSFQTAETDWNQLTWIQVFLSVSAQIV